ncbi:MAG: MraY family glycosyltransferase [Ferruginibacter sp.]|nr:undecaprenyl/decaprenyl-phosphate alpha-N-acetylglucosaminyl 1-phosphate transferase [Ferruginibacter sp.]
MQYIILGAILAFIISFFAIPIIIGIAKSKKLFDEPDERKVHKAIIPTIGGVGIFAGFIIGLLMCVPEFAIDANKLKYFAAAIIVIFFLGLKDDLVILSASKKLIGQIIAAGIIIRFGNVYIDNMHGFLGITTIPHYASIFFTLFTIIVITNSFNLIDGVDGLAGSLGLLTTAVFGLYFYFAGQFTYAVMAFSLVGAIAGFLIYNFSPAKIFMGDTGSLLLGLINSILVIKFINVAGTIGNNYSLPAAPALGFAILIVPLFDTLRVFGLRILDRRSPFSPDRIHVHHYLLDLGFSHRKITFICATTTILFISIAFFLRALDVTILLMILLALSFLFIGIIFYFRQKIVLKQRNSVPEKKIRTQHSIFEFSQETAVLD